MTNLELQKILYLAHMLELGRSDGKKVLITEPFEAWDYGPVNPKLYHRVKIFGSGPVGNVFHGVPLPNDPDDLAILKEVADGLATKSAGDLVAITHWDNGAWAGYYRPGKRGTVIPNAAILDEYKKRIIRSGADRAG